MPGVPLRLAVALNGYGLDHSEPDGLWREILSWEDVARLARRAEELRYEAIYAPEIGGWEAFTLLGGIASETTRIGLVSGVIPLRSRDPEHLAMGAASLQELSSGRFTLGVGHNGSIARTRSLVEQLRELISTGHGYDHIRAEAWATDWKTAPREVPVHLAALGPRMVELAGELADGVILNWCTPERVAEARGSAPQREGFTLAVYVRACLSPVDERAAESLRIAATRYAGIPTYRRQFEAMGLDPSDPEGIADRVCVRGDRDRSLGRLREYAEAGADLVVLYPVPAGEAVSSIEGTMMAAAPDPAVEP